mmetsp:Transcript_18217/g.22736  ORF Transcript_18217/g.22736 Transcript_18217/m.22736 type:complete len:88 (+) Transcript_18217:35-298(+)
MCTKQQFLTAFWSQGYTEMSEHELDKLLAYVDDDKNGFVTFEEFFIACLDPDDVIEQTRLKAAFKIFDQDSSGSISIEEFRFAVDKN